MEGSNSYLYFRELNSSNGSCSLLPSDLAWSRLWKCSILRLGSGSNKTSCSSLSLFYSDCSAIFLSSYFGSSSLLPSLSDFEMISTILLHFLSSSCLKPLIICSYLATWEATAASETDFSSSCKSLSWDTTVTFGCWFRCC